MSLSKFVDPHKAGASMRRAFRPGSFSSTSFGLSSTTVARTDSVPVCYTCPRATPAIGVSATARRSFSTTSGGTTSSPSCGCRGGIHTCGSTAGIGAPAHPGLLLPQHQARSGTNLQILTSAQIKAARSFGSAAGAAAGVSPNLSGQMRTLAKLKNEEGIWMDEKPIPEPGYNDVLIKINKTAICGTDVSIYKWGPWAQQTIPVGMTVGHEYVGTVVDMGEGAAAKGLTLGTRVSGEGHLVCGMCRNCRAGRRHLCRKTVGIGVNVQGAFAEYLSLPVENVFPIPDGISDEVASIFDPFGNALHTAFAFDVIGEDVLVTGAGPIGIMGAMLAKHAGARRVVITDVNEYRLQLAAQMPQITRAVNVAKEDLQQVAFEELKLAEGFDVGLEMSGSQPAFAEMVRAMNHGGNIAVLGLLPDESPINWTDIIFKGLTLKGIYGREMFETWYKMTAVLDSGFDVGGIITHRYKVDDYEEAFRVAVGSNSGKVILDWD